jgi:hypothetical protein
MSDEENIPFTREDKISERDRDAHYAVHGFWSGCNVTVSQRRDYLTNEWEPPHINWSCGGRDFKAEPDCAVAVSCFAGALMDAVAVARKWKENV